MAKVFPFQPYRYTPKAGSLDALLTQPYDKITPAMQARYLSLSPYNLVQVELGPREPSDDARHNVYTRAAALIERWIEEDILAKEEKPSFFPYFQEYQSPETGHRLVRKGFIGLGSVEDYSEGHVFRHEQTLTGPKKDRIELLRHTRAHTGQLFMLYDDRHREVDRMLDEAAQGRPCAAVTDEHGTTHTLWRIADEGTIGRIQHAMTDKKLIIADGHHRYETALAFHRENPGFVDASRVMMTFVNMYAPGLTVLATHRVVSGLEAFEPEQFLEKLAGLFRIEELPSREALRSAWEAPHAHALSRIGLAIGDRIYLAETTRPPDMIDVSLVHDRILGDILGIGADALREQKNVRYLRSLDEAVAAVRDGAAQLAILLEPTPIAEVARIAFGGGVLPQKSTDFYPKMLSGMAIYRLER